MFCQDGLHDVAKLVRTSSLLLLAPCTFTCERPGPPWYASLVYFACPLCHYVHSFLRTATVIALAPTTLSFPFFIGFEGSARVHYFVPSVTIENQFRSVRRLTLKRSRTETAPRGAGREAPTTLTAGADGTVESMEGTPSPGQWHDEDVGTHVCHHAVATRLAQSRASAPSRRIGCH
eukprot:scaffold51830_cov32-Tisochrysis_lutea.AAC.4